MASTVATIDLRPARLNVKSRRGDDIGLKLTIREGGVDADVSARTYRAQLRQRVDDPTVVATFTIDMTSANLGLIVLRMEDAVTATLEGRYAWDLEQNVSGSVRTLLAGEWLIDPDVTR